MTPADTPDPCRHPVAANDNDDAGAPAPEVLREINEAVFQLTSLIGCRMAREGFAHLATAKDNGKGAE